MAQHDGNVGPGRRRRIVLAATGLVALAAAALALLWLSVAGEDPPAPAPARIDADDRALVALGRNVYAAHCAACHGVALEGEANWRERKPDGTLPAPPHDETGHTWHHPDSLLFEITRSGGQSLAPAGVRSGMPGFGGLLSDREIAAALAFIKSRWPAAIRRRQEQISRRQ